MRVSVRIQYRGNTFLYWDESGWTTASTFIDADLTNNGTNWTLPNVDFSILGDGDYRVRLIAEDAAGNIASSVASIPAFNFIVGTDTTDPTAQVTSPGDGDSIPANVSDVVGTASDDLSGVTSVRVRVQYRSGNPILYWTGSINGWTTASTFLDADLSNNGTSWTLPNVDFSITGDGDYRVRLIAEDAAGNIASSTASIPASDFTVGL